jgi:hypothetical protein
LGPEGAAFGAGCCACAVVEAMIAIAAQKKKSRKIFMARFPKPVSEDASSAMDELFQKVSLRANWKTRG